MALRGYGRSVLECCSAKGFRWLFAFGWQFLTAKSPSTSSRNNSGNATPPDFTGRLIMPTITTGDGTEIFYKDWGSGQPLVFSHGWPLSADDWDIQMMFFLQHGYRVIAHDRRGHGRSTQTATGHDMDHYADDLAALTAHL